MPKKTSGTPRTEVVTVRMTEELKRQIDQSAEVDQRSLVDQINYLLVTGLRVRTRYYEKLHKKSIDEIADEDIDLDDPKDQEMGTGA
jgi:hypothetical protein